MLRRQAARRHLEPLSANVRNDFLRFGFGLFREPGIVGRRRKRGVQIEVGPQRQFGFARRYRRLLLALVASASPDGEERAKREREDSKGERHLASRRRIVAYSRAK